MNPLPLIPTPPGQRWREFRVKFLPAIVFACTIGAIVVLWREHVLPPTLVAQVEPVVREVRAEHAGFLTNLFVDRFQTVQAGEVLAEIITTDSRQFDARLQAVRGQISLAQLERAARVDRERLAFDYHNLRIEYMRQETELQVARAQLPHQEFDATLARQLLAGKVVSETEYHRLLSLYESTQARISQLSTNVVELEQQLEAARSVATFSPDIGDNLLQSITRLEAERGKLETLGTERAVLRAPIAGIISAVHRHPGESLLAGEPILSISGVSSERLVGYMRPPYAIDPKLGMKVQIRTRSWNRLEAEAMVTGVGAQFEVITNVAFLRPNAPAMEMGLPISFNIPGPLKQSVIGGELVDVILR